MVQPSGPFPSARDRRYYRILNVIVGNLGASYATYHHKTKNNVQ